MLIGIMSDLELSTHCTRYGRMAPMSVSISNGTQQQSMEPFASCAGTPMPSIVLAPPIVASPVQNGATSAPTTAAATAMANAVMQQLENITTNVNNTSSNGEAGSADRAPDQVGPFADVTVLAARASAYL